MKKLVIFFGLLIFSTNIVFAQSGAVYKINEVKNGNGEVLSSVKIYIDNLYTHHYAPETLSFCPGCHCDDDKNVDCELGEHILKLEKTGYLDWTETKTFNEGDSFEINPVLVTPTPIPTPTLSPTAVPTSTPTTIPTATFKISETKNESNEILSSVKIFLDGNYICHYAPETITFCNGCQHECDGVMVNYGFGSHSFRLEKSSYQDWEEERTINSGDNFEVSPVMQAEEATSPTPTSTSTPIPTPTKKITLTPTPTGEVLGEAEEATESEEIALSTNTTNSTESAKVEPAKTETKKPTWPILLVIVGFGFIFGAAYYTWYHYLR